LRFCKEDIDRLRAALQPWNHLSPREPDIGEYGRLSRELAKQNGNRLGRKRGYTDGQADEVRQLRHDGKTLTQIENKTRLSRMKVRRILAEDAQA
jgi:hypothetical protein